MKEILKFFIFLVLVSFCLGIVYAPPSINFKIDGHITYFQDGSLIEGANISLTAPNEDILDGQNWIISDVKGYYEINVLFGPGDPGNDWLLCANHPNYIESCRLLNEVGPPEYIRTEDFSLNKIESYDPNDPEGSLIQLTINGEHEDFTGVFPTETTTIGWKNTTEIQDGELHLFLDDVLITSHADVVEHIEEHDVGTYEYKLIFNNSQNYEDAEIIRTVTITQAESYDPNDPEGSLIQLTINGEHENFVGVFSTETNVTGWKNTTEIQDGELYLFLDDVLITSHADVVEHIEEHGVGTYEYKLIFTNSQNYEDAEIIRTVTIMDTIIPNVNLMNPIDNYFTNDSVVEFEAEFTDAHGLKNATLHVWNSEKDLIIQETDDISGNQNQTSIFGILNLQGIYEWNYLACNELDNCAWAEENWTLTLDTEAPEITLTSPAEGSKIEEPSVDFQFIATDNFSNEIYCELFVNNNMEANDNVINNTEIIWTVNLNPGNYEWYVSCRDESENSNTSETRNVEVTRKVTPTPTPPTPPSGTGVRVTLELIPTEIEMNSDEIRTIEVYVENHGDQYIADVDLSVIGLSEENYEFSKNNFKLSANSFETIDLILTPEFVRTGEYNLEVRFKSTPITVFEDFVLIVYNVFEDETMEICGNALGYIEELEEQEIDTNELREQYNNAENLMNENNFENALQICSLILEFEPIEEEPEEEPTITTGITGLFISAGEFGLENIPILSLIAVVIILIYLGRGSIITFYKNLKKPPEEPPVVGKTGSRNYSFSKIKSEKIYEIEW